MKRAEFMQKLSDALSVLPEEERQSALSYYEEYFNDAEDEERAVVELGTPEYVARTILEDFRELSAAPQTERQEQYTPPPPYEKPKQAPPRSDGVNKLLLIVVLVLLSPIIIGVGVPLIAGLFCVVIALICVLFAVVVSGIACVIAGVFVIFYSIVRYPFLYAGMFSIGSGFVAVGVGIFLTIAGGWACWKAVPAMLRGFVNICRMPFNRRKAGA